MTTTADDGALSANAVAQFRRTAHIGVPLMLLVPIALGLGAAYWLAAPRWAMVGFGALGWLVALMLRSPIGAILGKPAPGQPPSERNKTIMVAASGPVEELVRLGLVLLFAGGLANALWAGLGWASIEVVFTCVNSIVLASLIGRNDKQAQEVYQVLSAQGLVSDRNGLYAVLERVSASLLHVGFTLLLAWQPILVIATVVVHSATNLVAVRLAKRSLARTELIVAVIGVGVFAIGLTLWFTVTGLG